MKNESRIKHYILAIVGIVAGVVLDQFAKHLVVLHLKDSRPFVILDDVFQLEYLENRGAAFGLFQNQRIFFFLSALVISVIAIWFYLRVPMEKRFLPLRICTVLIVSGACGNLIDRLFLGYVVDFLYFKLIDFPVFNVADIFVTVSAVILVILICFYYKEEDLERIFHRGE